MRSLTSFALLAAGAGIFVLGLGPTFFGEPLLGVPLLLAGLGLEIASWRRFRRGRQRPAVLH